MVTIIAAHKRSSEKSEFISLEVMGDLEMVQSQVSGKFYATARKCFLSSTFDAETAKSFIGQTLPGTLERIACEPYTYKVPGTKEEITLSHTYSYVPPESKRVQAEDESDFLSEVDQLRQMEQY